MILYRYPTIVAIIVIAALVFAYEQTTGPLFLLHYGAVPQEINQAWDSLSSGAWSLAVVGKSLGYAVKVVMPRGQTPEKEQMIALHGAELHLVDAVPFKNENHFYHTARRIGS